MIPRQLLTVDYKTMDLTFMESVWNVMKQLDDKELVYRGFKVSQSLCSRHLQVMPYSTRCATPLSNFEANMPGCYKQVADPSGPARSSMRFVFSFSSSSRFSFSFYADSLPVIVSFPLVSDANVSFVAWTTTPWTLPSNLALCVHPDLTYVTVLHKAKAQTYAMLDYFLLAPLSALFLLLVLSTLHFLFFLSSFPLLFPLEFSYIHVLGLS